MKNLTVANTKYKDQADNHRMKQDFEPGDLVMVHIKESRRSLGAYPS